ncbi:MAG TPA: GatB/YqeY domain-containing protein [Candidatus Limnocylindrales bacterium]|nr:GatB/YqeY domain-containing protein [Candidatus Limnocylindrales bacterium]
MTLRERLQADIAASMKAGDALTRDTLRMVSSAAYNAEKAQRQPLTDEQFSAVLVREVKTRRESVEAFRAGGREDLAAREEAEIAILSAYLPEQLSDDAIAALVAEAIETTGAGGPKDMGTVMGWLSPRTRGRADGRRVAQLVTEALAGR